MGRLRFVIGAKSTAGKFLVPGCVETVFVVVVVVVVAAAAS
jgi:hypothetical protein